MEVKKTPRADLENERTTFFLIGLVFALATVYVLLEWRSEETFSPNWEQLSNLYIEEELIEKPELISSPEPLMEENKPPEKVNDEPKVAYEDFNIVQETPAVDETVAELFGETESKKEEEFSSSPPAQKMPDEVIYADPEVMPQYPGGYTELNRFLFKNIKYPASATSQNIQGRVWCSFIVNKDGSVSDIRVEKGVYISLDQEAVRVLSLMPSWIPGTVRGEAVRVKFYLPVVFHL
jgi:protein TonB